MPLLAFNTEYGEQCSFAEFLNQLKPIVNAVSIPISVDIESGYSNDINTICQHVLAVAKLGAVGINIEDSDKVTGKLRPQEQQIAILVAIKKYLKSAWIFAIIYKCTNRLFPANS